MLVYNCGELTGRPSSDRAGGESVAESAAQNIVADYRYRHQASGLRDDVFAAGAAGAAGDCHCHP